MESETPAPLPLALVSFVWTLTTGLQVVKLVQRSPQRKEAQERVMGVRDCYPPFSTSAKIIGLDAFLRSGGRQPSRGIVWKLSRSHVPQQRRPRHYIRSPIEPDETAYCAPETRKDVNANRSLWPSAFCSRTARPHSFFRAFGKTSCEFSSGLGPDGWMTPREERQTYRPGTSSRYNLPLMANHKTSELKRTQITGSGNIVTRRP
jgi:hypothetical protein